MCQCVLTRETILYYKLRPCHETVGLYNVSLYDFCNFSVGATNDLLSVDIRKSDFLEVICRPLTRFEGTASCVVTYMILPDAVNYIEASDTVGGAEDIISVLLIGAPEMTISIAAATQGGTQDIVVNGSFETGIHTLHKEALIQGNVDPVIYMQRGLAH